MALLVSSPKAFAQGATGAINGTVTDSTGAVIPGAKVVLRNVATGTERVAVANETGSYVFVEIPPGNYTMVVSVQGFSTAKEQSFTLNVNQTSTHNFTLTVGATVQEVTVSATMLHVEASTAELGTAIAPTEVNSLPLNGRNFTQLLELTPGVSPISTAQNSAGGGSWAGNTLGSFTFPSVNGQCNRCNFFLLDGFNNQQAFMAQYGVQPVIDAIQEFKVQSHNDSSSYGGALGGIVNVVTKTGTNEYHGDVWEFLRNSALDSRSSFIYNKTNPMTGQEEPGTAVTPYKQNVFGAVFGGPLIPGHFRSGAAKTWFYGSYEGWRSVRSRASYLFVPTPTEMTGDLSDLTNTQIYNPFTTRPDPANPGHYLRDPFMCDGSGSPLPVTNGFQAAGTPCNRIPSSLINQNIVKYTMADLPTPIATGVAGTNQIDNTPNRYRQDTFSLRFDHQFSQQTSGWVRYSGFTQPDALGTGWIGTTQNVYYHGYQTGGSITHTFGGGSKVLTAGFARNSVQNNYTARLGVAGDLWSLVGFSPYFAAGYKQSGSLNPSVCASGYSCRPSGQLQDTHLTDVYQEKVDFTWVHGHHTLQMGGDIETDNTHSPIEYDNLGFSTAQTWNPANNTGGSSLASMLIGVPDNANRRNVDETVHGGWVDGFYFQDSWKATDKLMINIGLRYDLSLWPIYGSAADKNQFVGNMDLDNGIYIVARVPGKCDPANGVGAPCIPTPDGSLPAHVIKTPHSNNSIYDNTHDNFGPRLGLAYRLRPNTAIRAAAVKFFDNWGALSCLSQNYEGTWPDIGQQIANNLNYPVSANPLPTITFNDPFNVGGGAVPLPAPTPFNQVQWFMDPRTQNAYSEQWNLGIQQSLGTNTVLEADYVGSHSSRLNEGGYRNVALTPGPGDPSLRRPYPYITPTFYDKSIGKASYNAFQFKLRRSTSKGLSYIISYTWSKVINLGCDGFFGAEGCDVQQIYNLKAERSVGGYDVPHMLNVSWTYDLPFGKGKKYSTGSSPLDALVGNWAVNGIYSVRSGEPFNLGVNGDIANTGNNTYRPNIVGPAFPGTRTRQDYLNTSSFQIPALYTFGSLGRNALRLTYMPNWDISIFRDFPLHITEASRLQFRAEFFNAFNYSVLGAPDSTVQDTNFGLVTSQRNAERQIQFALKLYF